MAFATQPPNFNVTDISSEAGIRDLSLSAMSRSPLPEGRSPKRQKTSTNLFDTVMTSPPENVVDVITDGDAMLVVSGLAGVKKQ